MSNSPLAGVSDTVSDVWSNGAGTVHGFASTAQGLAATAAEFAADVAVAAAEQLEDLPERVAGLAAAAKGRIGPTPKRSVKPWVLVIAGIVAFVGVAWWLRRRSSAGSAVDIGPDGRTNPVRAHHGEAVAAATP